MVRNSDQGYGRNVTKALTEPDRRWELEGGRLKILGGLSRLTLFFPGLSSSFSGVEPLLRFPSVISFGLGAPSSVGPLVICALGSDLPVNVLNRRNAKFPAIDLDNGRGGQV
jgi:hypothetical protein